MALSTKDYTAIDMQAANNNSLGECKFSITKSGGRFSAHFIKTYALQSFQSITYYKDNSNPYRVVFQLTEKANAENSTSIGAEGKTGRVFNINGLINIFPAVKKIVGTPHSRHTHRFDIHKIPHEKNCFYCDIIPMFEQSRAWKDKNSIPNNTNGIYRYLNHEDTVIYIGMGNIKERTSEADRKDWGIKTIQFSEVLDFSENKKVTKEYESIHISTHKKMHEGNFPIYNRVNGVRT